MVDNSLRLAYVVCVEQTIEEQKIKFDFYGEMDFSFISLYKMCIDLVTLKKWYKPKVGNSEDSVESTLDDGTTVVSQ